MPEEGRVEAYQADIGAYGWESAVGGSGAAAIGEEEEVCCCGGGFALENDGEGDFGFGDAFPWVGGFVGGLCGFGGGVGERRSPRGNENSAGVYVYMLSMWNVRSFFFLRLYSRFGRIRFAFLFSLCTYDNFNAEL